MKTNSKSMVLQRAMIAVLVIFSVMCFLRPMNSRAATPLTLVPLVESNEAGTKVGTKYYRVSFVQKSEEVWNIVYETSKSAKKGYNPLIQENSGAISDEMVTDGKSIYYLAGNKLICYNIAKQKKTTVMTVKKATKNSALAITHVKGNDIYVVNNIGRVDVRRIYRINLKKKTCKVLAKNVTVLDTFGYSRYNTIKKDGKNGLCSLYTLDKETGKTTLISNVVAGPPATAAGGDYPKPNDASSKYTTFIEYNSRSGKYTLMTYNFASKKAKAQKSWKWNHSKISDINVFHDYSSMKTVAVSINYTNGKNDFMSVNCKL